MSVGSLHQYYMYVVSWPPLQDPPLRFTGVYSSAFRLPPQPLHPTRVDTLSTGSFLPVRPRRLGGVSGFVLVAVPPAPRPRRAGKPGTDNFVSPDNGRAFRGTGWPGEKSYLSPLSPRSSTTRTRTIEWPGGTPFRIDSGGDFAMMCGRCQMSP